MTHMAHMTHGDPLTASKIHIIDRPTLPTVTHLTHQTHGSIPYAHDPFDPLTDRPPVANCAGHDPFDPSADRPGQRDVIPSRRVTLQHHIVRRDNVTADGWQLGVAWLMAPGQGQIGRAHV